MITCQIHCISPQRTSVASQEAGIQVSQEMAKHAYHGQFKRPRTYLNCEASFKKDYVRELQELYPDPHEKADLNVLEPLIDEMAITVFLDLDHAYDKVTRRSVTVVMIYVGQTPVFFWSKQQGAVENSTHRAELWGFRHAVEDNIAVR
jgi:hypothetical protein